jgi:2-hydroxychromene-2-carboxylate isomerase
MKTLEFWYEFASTYSYLAAMRVDAVAAGYGIEILWRPFLLGPIFKAQGMNSSPFNIFPRKGAYMWRDMERQAKRHGLPFRRPVPFPQHSLMATRLGLVCESLGLVEEYSRAVFRAEFAGGARIDDEATLRRILSDLGVPVEQAMERAASADIKWRLRERTEQADRVGIFGAPTFITRVGELFWGDDRLEQAMNWAMVHG